MANHPRLFHFYYLIMAMISFWVRMCFWSTATLLYISGSQTIIEKPKLFDRNSFFVNILVLRRYKSAIIDIAHFWILTYRLLIIVKFYHVEFFFDSLTFIWYLWFNNIFSIMAATGVGSSTLALPNGCWHVFNFENFITQNCSD